jgi:hypothetical protein
LHELVDSIWRDKAAATDLYGSELAGEEVLIQLASTEIEHLSHFLNFEQQLRGGRLKLLAHSRSVGGRVSRTTRYQQSQ